MIPPHYEVHLHDYLYILRKRSRVILAFLITVLAGAILFTFFEKVVYRASATLMIERENPNILDFKEVMALDASSTDYYQTQYQMLRSVSLIETLIRQENLQQDPYLAGLRKGHLRQMLAAQRFFPSWLREFLGDPSYEDVFVRKMLKIDPMRNSRLVEVSVIHPDPQRAQKIADSLADLFIRRNIEDRYSISQRATEQISQQLVDLKEKVAAAEKKLQEYKEKTGLTNIPSIRENNKFIQDAKLELVKLQSEESRQAKRYLPAHPKIIHLRSQIEGLGDKIQQEENRMMAMSGVAVEYDELEREANSSRQIYEALLARLQETTSEARSQSSNILIVDRAKIPTRPYRPQPFLNIAAALLLGLFGGIFLAFFAEYLDSTIKIPDDVEKGLGLELLGIVPRVDNAKNMLAAKGQQAPGGEAIRALRTALLFRMRHVRDTRILLVTSPNPEEGKSTVAFNLANAFQQNHLKVLLVDADLRKPRLSELLNIKAPSGLTDILEGSCTPEQAILPNVAGNGLDFLASGSFSPHPTEILGCAAMELLIEKLKSDYDVILVDSPPYLAVADVAVLSEYAQAMLVIARYHKTNKRHLRDLKRRFGDMTGKILGVVINQVGVREKDYYYQQYYYYGYGDAEAKG